LYQTLAMEFSSLYKFCPVCGSSHFEINNEKSKKCRQCGFVLYVNPSSAVAVFITNEIGELLVCERGKMPAKGTLDLPGGFVDAHETAEQAVMRELKEELNAEVEELKYLFSLPNDYEYSGLTIPTLDMFFAVTIVDFQHLKANDDVSSFSFVPLDQIDYRKFGLNSISRAVSIYLSELKY
jgi:NAD+ diphosphatase